MSLHEIPVVKIGEILPHPNADKLEITNVFGWQCVIPKGKYAVGSLVAYIPPDYVVPTSRPEFAFLDKSGEGKLHRVRVSRLRGFISQGLIVEAPAGSSEGDNLLDYFEAKRYEPVMKMAKMMGSTPDGQEETPPSGIYTTKFDVEHYQRYTAIIQPGEDVVITEKIDGANARYVWWEDKLHVGSRNRWVKHNGDNIWSKIALQYPQIQTLCKAYPGYTFYGEIYGCVQSLTYGHKDGSASFAAFSAHNASATWVDFCELEVMCRHFGVPMVPVLYKGPYDPEMAKRSAEEDSSRATSVEHIMEGVVVVPARERVDLNIGRVILKIVSNRYLEMK